MLTKFEAFAAALAALCRQHHVTIAPTRERTIGVWNVDEGVDPVQGLDDRTGKVTVEPGRIDLPPYFLTILAAKEFPGYLGHELTQSLANALASAYPGSVVISIGPPKHTRSWAVIAP